ncbi:hypothetical protein L2E82_29546 [Cichorium intybus]|uniref:Uncharacterized protein n=1 Tax=Cichorium intybus TaxID=13427 RepID=A0ACB9CXU9_CICIN|nr:hypothetical protein L2E82_29546 [Cichorium intybus]
MGGGILTGGQEDEGGMDNEKGERLEKGKTCTSPKAICRTVEEMVINDHNDNNVNQEEFGTNDYSNKNSNDGSVGSSIAYKLEGAEYVISEILKWQGGKKAEFEEKKTKEYDNLLNQIDNIEQAAEFRSLSTQEWEDRRMWTVRIEKIDKIRNLDSR